MNTNKQPNPKIHFYISILKSAIRIIAGTAIISNSLLIGGALIITAEVFGVLEEVF